MKLLLLLFMIVPTFGCAGMLPAMSGDLDAIVLDLDTWKAEVSTAFSESASGAETLEAVTDANAKLIDGVATTAKNANDRAGNSPITGNPIVDGLIGLATLTIGGFVTHRTTMKTRDANRRMRHEKVSTERTAANTKLDAIL